MNAAKRSTGIDDSMATVETTRIMAIDRHRCGLPVVLTDRPLDELRANWSRLRLANRKSRSRSRRFLLVRRHDRTDIVETNDVLLAWLPSDLRAGDVLSLPDRRL